MHIKVKVVTNAKKEKVVIDRDDKFEIHVKEKPEQNMANKRVLKIIQGHFKAPAKIISGHKRPNKVIEV